MKTEISFWTGVNILFAIAVVVGVGMWYYLANSPQAAGLVTSTTAIQTTNSPATIQPISP
jgi:hypothetical protein